MVNPIIPTKQLFYKIPVPKEPDLEAICIFTALGFFLGSDTYWRNEKVLLAGQSYQKDDSGNIIPGKRMFEWFYEPRAVSFDNAVEEFAALFADITREQVQGKEVILPLSGGLDSRSQAVVLKDIGYDRVKTYSYAFADSFDETSYGRKIAEKCGFEFLDLTIPEGYLWNKMDALSDINQCYSDFTHPRQMAVLDEIAPLGNIFHLGHWGDVLFDDMGIADDASKELQFKYLKHKILKKGGRELAGELWKAWGLPGQFDVYLNERLRELFEEIKIDNANSRIRAFKSIYWAPRWTSVNLEVFSSIHPLALPYYDDRMCRFICTVPEQFLGARKMQIEYIKRKAPEVAAIPWQSFSPCNLYNYGSFKSFKHYPYRLFRKSNQMWKEKIQGKRITTRNWEIQFKGTTNEQNLKNHLFGEHALSRLVPEEITRKIYEAFKGKDEVYYSHPLSMLLTLSQFAKKYL